MKFSKFKKFLLLSKKALICLNSSSILVAAKSIKEDFLVKMRSYKQKLILKKYPISRVYTSKRSVAYHTMGIITYMTPLLRKFILKKVWADFSFEILAHFSMAITLSRPCTLGKI